MVHGKGHIMEVCDAFKGKANKEKVEFMKTKRSRFGCLGHGYMSKTCQNGKNCQISHRRHPTIESKEIQRKDPTCEIA